MKKNTMMRRGFAEYKTLDPAAKKRMRREFFINNALYIFLIIVIIAIAISRPRFLSPPSLINILSLSAANLPIALGIAGAIILTGTDLSAGRAVGLCACVAASLLQATGYANKMFPELSTVPVYLVVLLVVAIGALIGAINGFCTAKFNLHPFIVTLATQLIIYGSLLMYLTLGTNNGQSISGLDESYTGFINGSFLSVGGTAIPNFVWYSLIITVIMWFVWNKTTFGKNMFAVGSNPEAAHVSGVNVTRTIILVFTLAGALYGVTGFIEGARIGSNSAATGLNYELDAIAACVIGGVSFVGGIGKIRGVIMGVVLLRIIFVGLTFLAVNQNLQYIIKGLIILIACAIDMRKYLVRK
ncbi:MAG: galactose/methyl galactoside ABC transporter permease MglC [Oscillospiraceae bacterium]|nr:galactose/methyl galactoside ABC transporter permease MglC [Oscillospiraceae bacterium]MBQ4544745.1 galactose/methyl galactoside ABC transporter permease MglC [Oscillospiraceae bacterium]MBQ6902509.1 galactose/methyl galactoside ABC transporter permease MglC [Oscillospiraceae bacterium]